MQEEFKTDESDKRSQAWAAGFNLNTNSMTNPSQVSSL